MRFTVIAVLGFVAAATAGKLEDYNVPVCARDCIEQAITMDGLCKSSEDVKCTCRRRNTLAVASMDCNLKHCGFTVISKEVQPALEAICRDASLEPSDTADAGVAGPASAKETLASAAPGTNGSGEAASKSASSAASPKQTSTSFVTHTHTRTASGPTSTSSASGASLLVGPAGGVAALMLAALGAVF